MSRAVVIRSGGLGDFLLTLPLLHALRPVTLITRRTYAKLIADDGLVERWLDIESAVVSQLFVEPVEALRELFEGARVVTFLRDEVLQRHLLALGAVEVIVADSRPSSPPHVSAQMLQAAGLPVPDDLLTTSWLAASRLAGEALWLHPGSGSRAKNAPFAWWREQIDGPTIVSFGEADLELLPDWEVLDVERIVEPSLPELRRLLTERAGRFIGNDTGVTHLAAALGIPTMALFRTTQPAIWRPLGQQVSVRWLPAHN